MYTREVFLHADSVFVVQLDQGRLPLRQHPHLFETNARILLERFSHKYGRRLTLGTVPEDEWKEIARRGFDLLWLMGVWQRSPKGRQIALEHRDLRRSYDEVLPTWSDRDVAGSPYAIYRYLVDPVLGEDSELTELKSKLNGLGVRLILDFVPNHLALDHPWVSAYPDRFVRGTEEHIRKHSDWFFSPEAGVHVAYGKDPYFPPWTDTAQVNFFSPEMRRGLIDELIRIATVADGVRCDMAMLALNNVFRRVWGWMLSDTPDPAEEFWTEATRGVRQAHPDFLFLAEAYWGLEPRLLELGFDFAYDKTLYDRLRDSTGMDIRQYLQDGGNLSSRAVRFIENHDEPRALSVFGPMRACAAAVVSTTLPGLRFFHDGQMEGRRVRLPIQLAREPLEPTNTQVAGFYDRLLRACRADVFHEGEWRLIETAPGAGGDDSYHDLLAWSWTHSGRMALVVVNYSPTTTRGRLQNILPPDGSDPLTVRDELTGEVQMRSREELAVQGFCVDLGPWCSHIFVQI